MSTKSNALSNLMWVEKYRPTKLDQVINQAEIVNGLSNLVRNSSEIPHLLFAGSAGVGKTTTALCIARELLGQDWQRNTLELNASDERGIKMVRERVKEFAAVMKLASTNTDDKPFRIIILDEADEMTAEAQTALRRIIEDSSKTTRFIIICNYLSKIIEPIQSRCVVFHFTRLARQEVIGHLKMICELRHSINILQASAGMGSVSLNNVNASVGLSGKAKVGEIIKLALAGKFNDARIKLMELTSVYGMSETDFLKYANQESFDMKLDNLDEFASIMAEYDYRMSIGAHPEIQLSALLAQLGKIGMKAKQKNAP
jgi:replication factor C small subunit